VSGEGHGVSRRNLLAAATAAGLAAGCRGRARTHQPELAFVGQDPERGHLLRSGALADAPVHERRRVDVLIVGGGVAGAAAAWRLKRAGVRRLELVELEPEVGGTARSGQLPRSAHPLGAHYLPVPHPDFGWLETLLEDLGVLRGRDARGAAEYDTTALLRAPIERHHFEGRWFDGLYPYHGQSGDDEEQFRRWLDHLRELDGKRGTDGRRLFTLPVAESSTQLRHLDAIPMSTYLDRLGITSWRVRWLVDYACRDDYGLRLEQTSAFAALHHFLARGMEDEHDRFILSWPEGNAKLVELMFARAELGERLHRPAAAYAIDPDAGEVRVHRFADDRNIAFEADVILWAAPRFLLPHVLPADPLARGALSYGPWLVASLELSEAPGGVGAPLSWDNVPVLWNSSVHEGGPTNLGYVVANHADGLDERRGGAVLTYYEPLCADSRDRARDRVAKKRAHLLASDLAALGEHVLTELERMHPSIRTKAERINVSRWGHAMIRPVPGLLFGDALATARASIGRVLPCATDTSGLPLFEEAFHAGVRGAESALARMGVENDSLP
jgi:hypothetical protein